MSSMRRRVLGIAVLAGAVAIGASSSAAAADAVPGEVVRYIAENLVDDLNEFYGPGADDEGIEFTSTTTTTPAVRVYGFTDDFLAGRDDKPEVRRVNEWVTVLAIDEEVVGFAVVSIDPATVSPQLTAFSPNADLGSVLAAWPEEATLVRDDARLAWFSLTGDTLAPLAAGISHVTEPVSLSEYRDVVAALPADTPDDVPAGFAVPSGLILAVLVLALVALLLAVEAFLPYWQSRATPAPEPEADAETVAKPTRAPRKKATASD